jgi:hypothetical protein
MEAASMPAAQRARRGISRRYLFLLVIAAVFAFACSSNKQQFAHDSNGAAAPPAARASPQTNASPELNKTPGSRMPALAEVEEAVKRVCVNAVTIDTSQSSPSLVGDFNGDDSEDLAVIVRPAAGALPRLNSEYANWIIIDPRKVVLPDPNKAVQRLPKPPAAVKIGADDVLLLVLHGYQETGWHHQYARQTFLLKNAVGENMRAQSVSEVSRAEGNKNPLQQRPGDVIAETLTGRPGFLYWTNGKYAWWNSIE